MPTGHHLTMLLWWLYRILPDSGEWGISSDSTHPLPPHLCYLNFKYQYPPFIQHWDRPHRQLVQCLEPFAPDLHLVNFTTRDRRAYHVSKERWASDVEVEGELPAHQILLRVVLDHTLVGALGPGGAGITAAGHFKIQNFKNVFIGQLTMDNWSNSLFDRFVFLYFRRFSVFLDEEFI